MYGALYDALYGALYGAIWCMYMVHVYGAWISFEKKFSALYAACMVHSWPRLYSKKNNRFILFKPINGCDPASNEKAALVDNIMVLKATLLLCVWKGEFYCITMAFILFYNWFYSIAIILLLLLLMPMLLLLSLLLLLQCCCWDSIIISNLVFCIAFSGTYAIALILTILSRDKIIFSEYL